MSTRRICVALLMSLLGACYGRSDGDASSASNWLVCSELSDCRGLADAVSCQGGFCVDDMGTPIEDPGAGGAGAGAAGEGVAGAGAAGAGAAGEGAGAAGAGAAGEGAGAAGAGAAGAAGEGAGAAGAGAAGEGAAGEGLAGEGAAGEGAAGAVACGPVCQIFCPNGNVLDDNGCPTCNCRPTPELRTVEDVVDDMRDEVRRINYCDVASECVAVRLPIACDAFFVNAAALADDSNLDELQDEYASFPVQPAACTAICACGVIECNGGRCEGRPDQACEVCL